MAEKKQSFESSLKKLEEIVKKMEDGDLALDQSLKIFEEGTKLVQFCENALNEAEGRVEQLITQTQGKKQRVPFEETE